MPRDDEIDALGSDDADAMAADGIEHRLDVDEPQTERPGRDEKRLGTGYPLDADFGRHAAPRERPAPLGRYAVTAKTPAVRACSA